MSSSNSYPIAMVHGISTSCDSTESTGIVHQLSSISGLHTECIPVGNGKYDSERMDILSQAKDACEKIKANPIYNQGPFNIIGFS